jgi:hypothetical protein
MPEPYDYPTAVVSTVLGLIGLLVFIACVISLAASVTWLVVKLIPARDETKPPETESPTT